MGEKRTGEKKRLRKFDIIYILKYLDKCTNKLTNWTNKLTIPIVKI